MFVFTALISQILRSLEMYCKFILLRKIWKKVINWTKEATEIHPPNKERINFGQKTIFATLSKLTELHASLYQWTINEAWCAFQAVSGRTQFIRVDLPAVPLSNAERETILPHTKFHTRHQRTRGYSQSNMNGQLPASTRQKQLTVFNSNCETFFKTCRSECEIWNEIAMYYHQWRRILNQKIQKIFIHIDGGC